MEILGRTIYLGLSISLLSGCSEEMSVDQPELRVRQALSATAVDTGYNTACDDFEGERRFAKLTINKEGRVITDVIDTEKQIDRIHLSIHDSSGIHEREVQSFCRSGQCDEFGLDEYLVQPGQVIVRIRAFAAGQAISESTSARFCVARGAWARADDAPCAPGGEEGVTTVVERFGEVVDDVGGDE